MAEFFDVHPLDDQGLRSDRPTTEVKFVQLTNVVNKDGSLVLRPGFVPVGPDQEDIEDLAVEWGIPVLIGEVFNPGNSATDRDSWTRVSETLRPDANSELVAGWTGDFTDIDEVVPDGLAYMESATSGSQESVGFANAGSAYDAYYGIVLRGRARQSEVGGYATLNIYDRSGSTNTLLDSIKIYAYKYLVGEANDDLWQNFAIPLAVDPADSNPWSSSTINGFACVIENGGGAASESWEYLSATGDGNYTEWVEYKDEVAAINSGAAAAYSDFDGRLIDGIDSDDDFATIAWDDNLTNDSKKQSWTMTGFEDNYNSISKVTLRCWVANFGSESGKGVVNLFFRSGGVDYTVLANQPIFINSGAPEKGQTVEIELTENPATSSAWTQGALSGSEWGIERVASSLNRPVLMGTDLVVVGNRAATPTLQLDNLAVDVYAVDDPLPDRLIVSTKNYFRLSPDEEEFTDVQGSATVTELPGIPHDSGILYGQIYMVDGTTTRRYPNASLEWEDFTDNDGAGTGKISGRTVTAFADRILYGWVKDGGDTTPERVAYSKQFNGGTHNDPSAGDFDLLLSPGGVVYLEALNDDICAAYKQTGVYMLRRTGFSNAPIAPDIIDAQTGLIAPLTCKTLVDRTGQTVQLFLGKNPKNGFNIFRFDGTSVEPIGDPIRKFLRDDSNKSTLENSFAELDPDGGFYWLFVPETTSQMTAKQAYVYDISGNTWKKATFSFPVYCAGRWTLVESASKNNWNLPGGSQKLIIGLGDNLPYKTDYTKGHDVAFPAAGGATFDYLAKKDGGEDGEIGTARYMFEGIIESGDLDNPAGIHEDWFPYKLHLNYYDKGPFYVQLSVSENGGKNYEVASTYWLGSYEADGLLKYASLDFPDNTINRADSSVDETSVDDVYATRFKITVGNQIDEYTTKIEFPKARVEWNSTGQNN